jgi:hypothetical protein
MPSLMLRFGMRANLELMIRWVVGKERVGVGKSKRDVPHLQVPKGSGAGCVFYHHSNAIFVHAQVVFYSLVHLQRSAQE